MKMIKKISFLPASDFVPFFISTICLILQELYDRFTVL
jgi:hypothetical protein